MIQDKVRKLILNNYLANGQIPWSYGYLVYRQKVIDETLSNSELILAFKNHQLLPSKYGYGLDERCVEYIWIFAQLDDELELILDAGSTLNHEFILEKSVWQNKKIHILTLAPEFNCYWQKGISYLFEDLRNIPIKDNYYDKIICVSTLEHIGLDNRQFTKKNIDNESKNNDFLLAVKEMYRILKPSGNLLLTVPFGKYCNMNTQQVFDPPLLEEVIKVFNPSEVKMTFFSYNKQGWKLSSISECQDAEYVDWIMLPDEKRPRQFPIQPDNAAAARAVACVKLVK